jgi:uncharacterized protein (DUF1697 family)
MKYIALLRGINVGGNHRVEMKQLKAIFESLGYTAVFTYINSGNIVFESNKKPEQKKVELALKKEFGFDIPLLIKTEKEMARIAAAIPDKWKNDTSQRTDVAYLFPEIDKKTIIKEMPLKAEFAEIIYSKGAIIWNILRKNYNKSHLNKIIGSKIYQLMTVRNANTARYLAQTGSKGAKIMTKNNI